MHGPFAYWLPQLQAGQAVTPARWAGKLGVLAASGYWLTVHAAVLVAAVLALASIRRKAGAPLPRLATFCLGTTSVLYLLLVIGEGLKRSYYLNRAELYASSFLLLSYLTVVVLLFGRRETRSWTVWLVAALYPALLFAKLTIRVGAAAPPLPMVVIAAVMAAALFVAFATEARTVLAAALVVLGLGSFLVRWPFERDDTIVAARNYIFDGGAFPRVFYEEREPQRNIFVSILAALTDHAMADHYSDPPRPIAPGDRIAILDSQIPADPPAPSPAPLPGCGRSARGSSTAATAPSAFIGSRPRPPCRSQPPAVRRRPSPTARWRPCCTRRPARWSAASAICAATRSRRANRRTRRGRWYEAGSSPFRRDLPRDVRVRGGPASRPSAASLDPRGGRGRTAAAGRRGSSPGHGRQARHALATFRLPVPMDRFEATSWFGGTGELTLFSVTIEQRLVPEE